MPWFDALLIFLLIGIGLSALATVWACRHAGRHGLVDQPGERRSHALPTPRGGGIGIVLVNVVACGWLASRQGAGLWLWIVAGLMLVASVGWWDDHRPLRASIRLLAHIASGGVLAIGLGLAGFDPGLVLLAFVLVPVLVNVWNFMDGINGLAVTQALLVAMALLWVMAGPWQMLAVAVVAGCIGFLPFNLVRARIFLGDVGSGALGYLMAVLITTASAGKTPFTWPLLWLPAAAFLVDAGMTLVWRMMRGDVWWHPHVQHLYQRMARRHGHLRVTALYAGWTVLVSVAMLALQQGSKKTGLAGAALILMVSMLVWWRLHREPAGSVQGFEQ